MKARRSRRKNTRGSQQTGGGSLALFPSTNGNPNMSTFTSLSCRLPNPFPVSRTVDLLWTDFGNAAATANFNVSVAATIGTNAAYDPKQAGSGDYQPYGFNVMAGIYAKYLVSSVKFELEFYDPSVDGLNVGYQIGLQSPSGVQLNVAEQRPQTELTSMSNSGDQKVVMRGQFPLHLVQGLKKLQWEDELATYGAAISANPGSIQQFYIFVVGINSGTPTVRYRLKVWFRTRFYQRLALSASQIA